jgi:probable phosphoglycerate mutase
MVREGPREPLAYYFRDLLRAGEPRATRLYLVRHAQSVGNTSADWQPDPPLTELGREQARLVGERLARQGVDAIFSSPLRRALETARPIAEATGLSVTVVDDLREIDVGPAETDAARIALEEREAIHRLLVKNPSWDAFPGSEGSGPFRARITAAIDDIVRQCPARRVAVVTHGGVIQTYVSIILGLPGDVYFYPFNAGITSIRALDDRRVLWRLNDIAHLDAAPTEKSLVS